MAKNKLSIPKRDEESTVDEWLRNHLPTPAGMTDTQWCQEKYPRAENESFVNYLARLVEDPVGSFLVADVPTPFIRLNDIHHAQAGRILLHMLGAVDIFDFFGFVDLFMYKRMKHLKEIGFHHDQNEERKGRYGLSMSKKAIFAALMRELGIANQYTLNLRGLSFYHSNVVTGSGIRPWPVLVTGHVIDHCIACTDGQLGAIRPPRNFTAEEAEAMFYKFKYQHYKAASLVLMGQDGNGELRAMADPKAMVERGLFSRTVWPDVWGEREDNKLDDETGRNVKYMKPCILPVDKATTPGIIVQEYRAKLDEHTYAPLDFLRQLEGFDPSKIGPAR
jgi:hypothetical protein